MNQKSDSRYFPQFQIRNDTDSFERPVESRIKSAKTGSTAKGKQSNSAASDSCPIGRNQLACGGDLLQ